MHGKAIPKSVPRDWYLWDGRPETVDEIISWQDPEGRHFDDPWFTLLREWEYPGESYTAEVYDIKHSRWIPLRTGDYVMKALTGECWPMAADVFDGTQDVTERHGE